MKIRSNPVVKKILIWKKAFKWTRYFLAYSGVFMGRYNENIMRARIRKEAHSIEKGLSLPKIRPGFGRDKIDYLLADLALAGPHGDLDAEIDMAEDVLRSYIKWHRKNGHDANYLAHIEARLQSRISEPRNGGTLVYEAQVARADREILENVLLSRRSVRHFSEAKVENDVIERAIRAAWMAPSVCNRQPWGVAVVSSQDMLGKMLDRQAGNTGFRTNIPLLLVILADTSAFVEDYELFEPYVDAGIFSGFLVNALHINNIGSCCLNLCVSHEKARDITATLGVDERFFPVMMIACGYPADHCEVAISARGKPVIFER